MTAFGVGLLLWNGLPLNIGLFLSTGHIYLFLPPSTPLNPFRFLTTASVSIFPCLASKFRNRSFVIYTSFHHRFQLLIIGHRYLLMKSPGRAILIRFLSLSDSRILNLYRLSKISSDGIFDMDSKTSSHLVSNSCTLSS